MNVSFSAPDEPNYYAIVGDDLSSLPSLNAWPTPGSFGAIPRGGAVVVQTELLDRIGPELWPAQRDGRKICLHGLPHRVEEVSLLAWAADCVDHALSQVGDTESENVAGCVQFARGRAQTRSYDKDAATRLTSDAEHAHRQFSRSTKRKGGKAILGGLLSLLGPRSLRPQIARYDSRQSARADADSALANLLAGAIALCREDVFASAVDAADASRKAVARNALTAVARTRANEAEDSSYWSLGMGPLARGRLMRSAPAQLDAFKGGGEAERAWQLERLLDCLGLNSVEG